MRDHRFQHIMDNLAEALKEWEKQDLTSVPRLRALLDDARSDLLDLVDGGGLSLHEKNQLDSARLFINRAVVVADKRYMPVGQFIQRAREHVALAAEPASNVVPLRRPRPGGGAA